MVELGSLTLSLEPVGLDMQFFSTYQHFWGPSWSSVCSSGIPRTRKMWTHCSEFSKGPPRYSGSCSKWRTRRSWELGLLSLQRERHRWDLITICKVLIRVCRAGKAHNIAHGKFLTIRKKYIKITMWCSKTGKDHYGISMFGDTQNLARQTHSKPIYLVLLERKFFFCVNCLFVCLNLLYAIVLLIRLTSDKNIDLFLLSADGAL